MLPKELQNCILCILREWLLFCSVCSVYFLPILSVKLVFRLSVFWLWIQFHLKRLNDTLKAFDDFKNRQQKSMNVFWCIYILKAYIFWKFIQYTILWSKTHWQRMLTKFPSDKLNVSKNALFLFLLFFFLASSKSPQFYF